MVSILSLPMFIACVVGFSFFAFTILFLRFFKHAELPRNTFIVFLLLALSNSIYTLSFGILMNAKDNLELINITNRLTIIASTYLVVLFFHMITKLFSLEKKKTLITFYSIAVVFTILLLLDSPLGFSNKLIVTNSHYLTLKKGLIVKLWGVYVLFMFFYTAGFIFVNYLKTSEHYKKIRKTMLVLLLFSIIWTIGGVLDALTAIYIIKIPPISWMSSLSIILTSAVILLNSFSNMNKKADSLYNELIHDKLTGCYSKTFFDIELKKTLDDLHRKNSNHLLIIFDIDNFKKINDNYGHLNGDLVLTTLIEVIQEELRAVDILARFGGDEFLILVEVASCHKGCKKMLSRIQTRIRNTNFNLNSKIIKITCSFGGVYFDKNTIKNELNADDLFVSADKALYKAKKAGKDRFVIS